MPHASPAFALVHGAWHGAATWQAVVPLLEARGHLVRALDLPGAGRNAKSPPSFERRPLDADAFAKEPSPNTATQQQRTRAVTSLVQELAHQARRPVVLVGHSLGGVTATAVAEAAPEHVHAVVYLAGFLLPEGKTVHDMIQHPTLAASQVPPLFLADPSIVGALRIDPRSEDRVYRQHLKSAFYGDVSDSAFETALSHLHCDEPLGVNLTPSGATRARFGRIRRHYIRCLNDQGIPIAAQDFMIGAADEALGGSTCTHALMTSHSPFASQPQAVADILIGIACEKHPGHKPGCRS